MFLKHPCITKSQTAKLLLGAGRTIYAIGTRNCAAYLLVVSCLQNRTWWERNRRCETLKACFSAAFAKSGPLDFPSEKIFSFIFCPRKGLKTHVSKVVKLFSNSLFLRRHKPKMIFGQTTPVNSDRDFFHRAATATTKLTEFYLAISYKMYSVSSQTKYGNFSWNIFHTSVIRGDPSLRPLFAYQKFILCTKELSKCRR